MQNQRTFWEVITFHSSSVFSSVLSSVFIYLFNNSEVLKEPDLFILVQAISNWETVN